MTKFERCNHVLRATKITRITVDITFSFFLSEDAGLCGLNGCPFHGMCLRDTKLGKYACQCPECYASDIPNYVCGKLFIC